MEQIAESTPTVRRKTLRHGHSGAAAKVHGRNSITNGKTLLRYRKRLLDMGKIAKGHASQSRSPLWWR